MASKKASKPKETKPRDPKGEPEWALLTRAECGERLRDAILTAGYSDMRAAWRYLESTDRPIDYRQLLDYWHGRRNPSYQMLHRLVTDLSLDPALLFRPPGKAKATAKRSAG
jgi:transcriptional regulator with XRE-family HTH domain